MPKKIIRISESELKHIIESYIDSSGQLKDFSFNNDKEDSFDISKFSSKDAKGQSYTTNDIVKVIDTGEVGKVLSLDAGFGSLIKFKDREERLLTNNFIKI